MSAATTSEVKSFGCSRCNLHFPQRKLLLLHTRENHPECTQCKRRFFNTAALLQHHQATEHCYCLECDIHFTNPQEQLTHIRSIAHTTLPHCCDCDREYANQDTLSHHCCDCDEVFQTRKQMKKHLSTQEHIRKVGAVKAEKAKSLSHKCQECDQAFRKIKQLKKHVSTSHKHIQCPVGKKCKKFATPSALLSHLESGRCSSGLTRARMHELVFAHDSNRYITSVDAADAIYSANNIPGNSPSPLPPVADDDSLSEWSEVGGAILTPTTSESDWSLIGRNALTPDHSDNTSEWSIINEDLVHISSNTFPSATNLEISSHSAQSPGLRCHLCRPDRKPFVNIRAYQAHMGSAAHAPKIFHCPVSFMPQVKQEGPAKVKYFSTLAGLTQHMESGRCEGGLEVYGKAISFVEEQLQLLGFSDFKLLKN